MVSHCTHTLSVTHTHSRTTAIDRTARHALVHVTMTRQLYDMHLAQLRALPPTDDLQPVSMLHR